MNEPPSPLAVFILGLVILGTLIVAHIFLKILGVAVISAVILYILFYNGGRR